MRIASELVQVVGDRREGWWSLLAAALGDEESRREARAGLSFEALTASFGGEAISPTIVEHRVQALAAHDRHELVVLSRQWKKVTEIGQDLMDPQVDFWTAAWRTALRFLKAEHVVSDIPVGRLPRALTKEFDVLFSPRTHSDIDSWEVARDALRAIDDYDDVRRLDDTKVVFGNKIGASELSDLLRPHQHGALRMDLLRFFFRRVQLIDEGGRRYLEHLVDANWALLHELGTTPSSFTVLIDLIHEFEDQEVRQNLRGRLLSSLRLAKTPERLLPVVYVLLNNGWRHP